MSKSVQHHTNWTQCQLDTTSEALFFYNYFSIYIAVLFQFIGSYMQSVLALAHLYTLNTCLKISQLKMVSLVSHTTFESSQTTYCVWAKTNSANVSLGIVLLSNAAKHSIPWAPFPFYFSICYGVPFCRLSPFYNSHPRMESVREWVEECEVECQKSLLHGRSGPYVVSIAEMMQEDSALQHSCIYSIQL